MTDPEQPQQFRPIPTITALANYFATKRSTIENIIYAIFPAERQPGRSGGRVWNFTADEVKLVSQELHTPGSVVRPDPQAQLAMYRSLAGLTIPTEDEMYDCFAEITTGPLEIPCRLNWDIGYVLTQLRANGYPNAHVAETTDTTIILMGS